MHRCNPTASFFHECLAAYSTGKSWAFWSSQTHQLPLRKLSPHAGAFINTKSRKTWRQAQDTQPGVKKTVTASKKKNQSACAHLLLKHGKPPLSLWTWLQVLWEIFPGLAWSGTVVPRQCWLPTVLPEPCCTQVRVGAALSSPPGGCLRDSSLALFPGFTDFLLLSSRNDLWGGKSIILKWIIDILSKLSPLLYLFS